MDEVISNLINERLLLIEKSKRLSNFIAEYGKVFNDKYIALMRKQHSIMADYITVLDDRIAMLKGEEI